MPISFSYPRYLEAKRSVDDRALNRVVLESLRAALARRANQKLRILEIGGGTGTMVRRLVEWDLLRAADYTLVDRDAQALAELPDSPSPDIRVHPVHGDISEFLRDSEGQFDLVIAHAVLDLIDLNTFLPLLWARCAPGAAYWFTINFDGESIFLPPLPEDQPIWDAYHASMNRRPGSSHAGRKLFAQLATSGATIETAGSSDWVVHPHGDDYEHDEAYFLHHIVHTIDSELREHPPVAQGAFSDWIGRRHAQVLDSELIYIAHQLDFFGNSP